MSDERTVLEAVARAAQACFQQHPVVILGSGASVPHKIRGMGELATFLLENVTASEGQRLCGNFPRMLSFYRREPD